MADSSTDALDALLADVDAFEKEAAEVEESKRLDFETWRQTLDRSRIAILIVWAFVVSIGLLIVFIFVGAVVYEGWADSATEPQWIEGAKEIGRLLQSVMLPVVTLVLGFYFGSSNRKS